MRIERIPGNGWLALVGGGEFSFGETEAADQAWLAKAGEGNVGFLPTASGSEDYGRHFAVYLDEYFERGSEIVPIYRGRDVRRRKSLERIAELPALYLGGGVADQLLGTLRESPAAEALAGRIASGGVVVAIASAAQAVGTVARDLRGKGILPGLGWLPGGVVEPNFEPAHDRRLRQLLERREVRWGVGIPAGAGLLLGPEGEAEVRGMAFYLDDAEGDFQILSES